MKHLRFVLIELILVPFIVIIGHSVNFESDLAVSDDIVENCRFQVQLNSCDSQKEIELLSSSEENEELTDQYLLCFNSSQRIFIIRNTVAFLFKQEHIQSFILFESDNSPPFVQES